MEDNVHTRDTIAAQTDTVAVKAVESSKQIKTCPECNQHLGVDAAFCPFDGTSSSWPRTRPPSTRSSAQVIDGRYEVVGSLGEGGMGTRVRGAPRGARARLRDEGRCAASSRATSDLAARFIQRGQGHRERPPPERRLDHRLRPAPRQRCPTS